MLEAQRNLAVAARRRTNRSGLYAGGIADFRLNLTFVQNLHCGRSIGESMMISCGIACAGLVV
jgi:hypothetical protein